MPPEEKAGSPWRSERFANRVRARHATVHALLEAGHSRRSIGRQLQTTHRTVKGLADAAKPEDLFRGQWQHNRTSVLDEYKPYLDERWGEGCSNAWGLWELWEEIVPLGYLRQDDLPSLHTLAAGTDRDRNAVIAGLTLPWSSGVVEGHVNRIKMLKRQMFGRAGFALLRKRVLLAE
ncbi:hypothetical protein GCM10023079_55090 [Streptomyces chitinivorans]